MKCVEVLQDRGNLLRVDPARPVALLDAVDRLLARELERLRARGLERLHAGGELVERAARLVGSEQRLQVLERRIGLGVELGDLLRSAILRLDIAVLDVEMTDDAIAARESPR